MKPEQFKALFDLEQISKLSNGVVKDISFYLGIKGVKNEDIILFVPVLSRYLQSMDTSAKLDHKANLKKLVDSTIIELNIESLVEPVREEYEVSKQNRRMDSLARLLALAEADTPCVAVALVNNDVVLSFNLSSKSTTERVKKLLKQKMGIIRKFLTKGSSLLDEGSLDAVMQLIKETRKYLMGIGSHSTALLPAVKRKRENIEKFMDVALGKLLTAVVQSSENNGFSDQDCEALLAGNIVVLAPKREVEQEIRATLHAEQMIASFVGQHAQPEDQKVYVGISKLCCAACRDVLNDSPAVSFRGTHGMTFSNVADTRAGEKMSYTKTTKLDGLSFADDSDSEPDTEDYRSARRINVTNRDRHTRRHHQNSRFFAVHVNDDTISSEGDEPLPQGSIISTFK